jgi:hypothetical protein
MLMLMIMIIMMLLVIFMLIMFMVLIVLLVGQCLTPGNPVRIDSNYHLWSQIIHHLSQKEVNSSLTA